MLRFFTTFLACLYCVVFSCANAQPVWPQRGVRIIVPYPAGQTTDTVARTVAQELAIVLGQAFFVDNRGGAGGIIGLEAAKRADADGYTILIAASGPLAINPSLYHDLPYHIEKDYDPVTLVSMVPLYLVVRSDFPANNVRELLAYVRARPGVLNYGSGGSGLTNHLTMEMFKSQAGLDMTHVPYRGASAAVAGLLMGDTAMMFEAGPAIKGHVQSGALKILAAGSRMPTRAFPDAKPVAQEGVPGFDAQAWIAMLVPAGTPRPIVERLNQATRQVLAQSALEERLAALGADAVSTFSAEDTRQFMQRELTAWAQAVKDSNAQAN